MQIRKHDSTILLHLASIFMPSNSLGSLHAPTLLRTRYHRIIDTAPVRFVEVGHVKHGDDGRVLRYLQPQEMERYARAGRGIA